MAEQRGGGVVLESPPQSQEGLPCKQSGSPVSGDCCFVWYGGGRRQSEVLNDGDGCLPRVRGEGGREGSAGEERGW